MAIIALGGLCVCDGTHWLIVMKEDNQIRSGSLPVNPSPLDRILNDLGDLLGEIVGGTQVFSQEAYLTLDVTIHERFPGVIRDANIQGHLGRSGDRGYFALFLAAFGERSHGSAQRDQVGRTGRIMIAATIHVLELSR